MTGRRLATATTAAGAVLAALVAVPLAGSAAAANPKANVEFTEPVRTTAHVDDVWQPLPDGDGVITLSVTGSDAGACTLDSTADDGTVTFTGPGTCKVTAASAGDEDHDPHSIFQDVVVSLRTQQVSWDAPPTSPTTTTPAWHPNPRSDAGKTVTLTVTPSPAGACTKSGTVADPVVTFSKTGTCTVTASVGADRTHSGDSITTSPAIAIGRTGESVTFDTDPPAAPVRVNDDDWTPAPVATSGRKPALNAEGAPAGACSLVDTAGTPGDKSDDSVSFDGAGICTVTAKTDQDDAYEGDEAEPVVIEVTKRPQPITVSIPGTIQVRRSYRPTVTSKTNQTPTFSLESSQSQICELVGTGTETKVRFLKRDAACKVTATVDGDTEYRTDSKSEEFKAGLLTPTISVTPPSNGDKVALTEWTTVQVVTESELTPALVVTSTPAGVCRLKAGTTRTVEYRKQGKCFVSATTEGQTHADENPVTSAAVEVNVVKADQTIAIVDPGSPQAGRVYEPKVAASSVGNTDKFDEPTFALAAGQSTTACTVVSGGVKLLKAGTAGRCRIVVTVPGNDAYHDGTQEVVVESPAQLNPVGLAISAYPTARATALGTDWTPDLTRDNATDVTLTSTTTRVCAADLDHPGSFDLLTSGTCTLSATAPPTVDQVTKTVTTSVQVDLADQPLTVTAPTNRQALRLVTPTVSAPTMAAPTSNVPRFTTVGQGDKCAAESGKVRLQQAGSTCVVTVTIDGNDTYKSATTTVDVAQVKLDPQLAITHPGNNVLAALTDHTFSVDSDNATGTVFAVASTSSSVCNLVTPAPRMVHFKTSGTCRVTLTADETANQDAKSVFIDVVIKRTPQTVSAGDPLTAAVALDDFTPQVGKQSTAAPRFTSTTPGICTATNALTVHAEKSGVCGLSVTVGEDVIYEAKTVTGSVTIAKRDPELSFVVSTTDDKLRYLGNIKVVAKARGKGAAEWLEGTGTVQVSDMSPVDAPTVRSWPAAGLTRDFVGPKYDRFTVTSSFTPTGEAADIYKPATKTETVTVDKASQTLSFTADPAGDALAQGLVVDETWTPAVTSSRGRPIDLSTTSTGCTVDKTTLSVTFLTHDPCVLVAKTTEAPTSDYENAPTLTTTFTPALRPVDIEDLELTPEQSSTEPYHLQTVTVTATAVDRLDPTRTMTGTATVVVPGLVDADGHPVTLTGKPSTDGTISDSFVAIAPSVYTVKAQFQGDEDVYALGTDQTSVTIRRAPQTLHITSTKPAVAYPDVPYQVTVTGGLSNPPGEPDLELSVDDSTGDICTVSGTTVTFTGAAPGDLGSTCTVTANQDGDTHYLDAASDSQIITVKRRPVTLGIRVSNTSPEYGESTDIVIEATDTTDPAHPALTVGDGLGKLYAPGLLPAAGVDLTYRNGRVTVPVASLPVGTFALSATFRHDRTRAFAEASGTHSLLVDSAGQSISTDPASGTDDVYVGSSVPVTAVGGASNKPVKAKVVMPAGSPPETPTPCEVTPDETGPFTITFLRPEPCTVQFDQAADCNPDGTCNYAAAPPQQLVFTAKRRPVRLTLTTSTDPTYDREVTVTVAATDQSQAEQGADLVPAPMTLALTNDAQGNANPEVSQGAGAGSASITYVPRAAGTQRLTVKLALSAAAALRYDFSQTGREVTFVVDRQTQTAVLTRVSERVQADYVGDVVTYGVSGNGGGRVILVPQPLASGTHVPVDDAPGDAPATVTYVGPHCSVTGLEVTLTSAGPCDLLAYRNGVTYRFQRSDATAGSRAGLAVVKIRQPVALAYSTTNFVTPPTTPPPPTVDAPLDLRALVAKDVRGRRVEGSGTIWLERKVGTAWVKVDGSETSDKPWVGSLRTTRYTPTKAGDYQLVEQFVPTLGARYDIIRPGTNNPLAFTVEKASQQVVVTTPEEGAPRYVGTTWTPVITQRGASGDNVVPIIADADGKDPAKTGEAPLTACEVRGDNIFLVHSGPCKVLFAQSDDLNPDYFPATPFLVDFTVIKAPSKVTLAPESTTAAPTVGTPYRVVATATGPSPDSVPLEGDFTFRLVDLSLPIGEQELASERYDDQPATATFEFTPAAVGGNQKVLVDFEPSSSVNFDVDSGAEAITPAAGKQLIGVAAAPVAAYVGDEWDPAVVFDAGPAHDFAPTFAAPTGDTGACAYNTATHRVDLLANGSCSLTFKAPAIVTRPQVGPDWTPSNAVTRTFDVVLNPVRVSLLPPTGATSLARTTSIDEQTPIEVRVVGLDSNVTPTLVDGTVTITASHRDRTLTRSLPVTLTGTGPARVATVSFPAWLKQETPRQTDDAGLPWGDYDITATFVPATPEPGTAQRWASPTETATKVLEVARLPQRFACTGTPLTCPGQASLPAGRSATEPWVGGSWTVTALTDKGLLAVPRVSSTDATVPCSVTGRVVTFDRVGSCIVTFEQDGTDTYELTGTHPSYDFHVVKNRTVVSLTPSTSPVVGVPTTMTAQVTAPNAPSGVPTPTGTLSLTAPGMAPGPAPTLTNGRATFVWTPQAAGANALTALYTPDTAAAPTLAGTANDDGTLSLTAAKAPVTLGLTVLGDTTTDDATDVALTATVRPTGASTPSGTVDFQLDGTSVAKETLSGGTASFTVNRATTSTFVVTAVYVPDGNHRGEQVSVTRTPPRLRAILTPAGSLEGWLDHTVTVRWDCASKSVLVNDCPTTRTLRAGRNKAISETLVGKNGGTTTVVIPATTIDVDAPVVALPEIKNGGLYYDKVPTPYCRASDALSGLRGSCSLKVEKLDRSLRRASATAFDRAGNKTVVVKKWRELQEWVQGAGVDKRGRFLVRPGRRIQVRALSTGETPVLRVAKGGAWRDGPALVATSVRNGVYTWYSNVKLPKSLAGYKIGVRVGSGKTYPIPLVAR